jgi:hypothetical protein
MAAGMTAGVMLLMRPNLLLLATAPAAAWLWPCVRGRNSWRDGIGRVMRFTAVAMPALVFVAILNARLYGSPFVSGYGGLGGDIYELERAPQNLRAYFSWLIQSQTWMVAFAIVPLFVRDAIRPDSPRASIRAGLAALFALTLLSYLFYYVFGGWFYLRYLLPALPALFVMMAAGIKAACGCVLPRWMQAPAAVLLVACAAAFPLKFAYDQSVFKQQAFEQRYVTAAEYVGRLTTPNAVILAVQHSGSVRYYAHRMTVRWDFLPSDGLDAVLRELSEKGYRPYIVIDDQEAPEFRTRFGAASRIAALDWQPLARIPSIPQVRIYDLEGRSTPGTPGTR